VPATARPLRFAAVGCGDIGFANARAISAAAGAELVLAYDVAPELADAVSARFGGRAVRSLEEALDRERADAVFLSVPHDQHVPLAIQAAEAGLHVVVEKPLATDLAGGEAVVAAAEAAGVVLSVCYAFRHFEAIEAARRLVQAGALGALRGATVVFHTDKPDLYWGGGFSGRATSDWRASRARAGGGVLIMNLTHYVDVLRHVAGAEPAWVAGVARTDEGAEVEDAIALSIGFEGGAIGTVFGSASTRGVPDTRFEVWGDAGTLILGSAPAIYTERVIEGVPAGEWSRLAPHARDDERRVFVERFAAAVRDGRAPDVTAEDALAVQAFVDAAYRATETGQAVAVQRPGVQVA
jgi:predicted dehydrogenase